MDRQDSCTPQRGGHEEGFGKALHGNDALWFRNGFCGRTRAAQAGQIV
jgi:hypothetical protein